MQLDNLKGLTTDIIASLTNIPNTLIGLYLYGIRFHIPLSCFAKLTNLQEMVFEYQSTFEDLKNYNTLLFHSYKFYTSNVNVQEMN